MNDPGQLIQRYHVAVHAYADRCAANPLVWHPPDVAEFTELRLQLLPDAEAGDAQCQYALATISWLGLCCKSEDEFISGQGALLEEATRWWTAAAKQGLWPALDNLIGGVGPETQRARDAANALERDRPDLIGWSHGMPVYGPTSMRELSRKLYGKVILDDEE